MALRRVGVHTAAPPQACATLHAPPVSSQAALSNCMRCQHTRAARAQHSTPHATQHVRCARFGMLRCLPHDAHQSTVVTPCRQHQTTTAHQGRCLEEHRMRSPRPPTHAQPTAPPAPLTLAQVGVVGRTHRCCVLPLPAYQLPCASYLRYASGCAVPALCYAGRRVRPQETRALCVSPRCCRMQCAYCAVRWCAMAVRRSSVRKVAA